MEGTQKGNAYRRARRAYVLSASLLLAWTLIGVEIGSSLFGIVDIELEKPWALPTIIFISVVYFAYRFTIEHYISVDDSRYILNKVDFRITHFIGISSIFSFISDRSYRLFTDDSISIYYFFLGMSMFALVVSVLSFFRNRYNQRRVSKLPGNMSLGNLLEDEIDWLSEYTGLSVEEIERLENYVSDSKTVKDVQDSDSAPVEVRRYAKKVQKAKNTYEMSSDLVTLNKIQSIAWLILAVVAAIFIYLDI